MNEYIMGAATIGVLVMIIKKFWDKTEIAKKKSEYDLELYKKKQQKEFEFDDTKKL